MVERMATVETKIDIIDEKLSKFIDAADRKYAAKWIEKLQYTTICSIIAAIVTKMIGLW